MNRIEPLAAYMPLEKRRPGLIDPKFCVANSVDLYDMKQAERCSSCFTPFVVWALWIHFALAINQVHE